MPVSHYPPVRHPETSEPGHWEGDMEYLSGKLVPVDRWIRHCPYHPFIELRGITPCERCASEPKPDDDPPAPPLPRRTDA